MYSIGQVSEMFGLPISTLRYYDKQGLFPEITRVSGIRKFSDRELEALRVIECLKKSGLEIKDIKQFMQWCRQGKETYPQRKQLFEIHQGRKYRHVAHLTADNPGLYLAAAQVGLHFFHQHICQFKLILAGGVLSAILVRGSFYLRISNQSLIGSHKKHSSPLFSLYNHIFLFAAGQPVRLFF